MKRLNLKNLDEFFALLSKKSKLYIPVDQEKGAKYKLYEKGDELSNSLNTLRSAKDFFFPQTEDVASFNVNGKNIEIIDQRCETEDFIVFGVRACDVKSFEILDSVFLANPVDTYYQNRRNHGTIISLACNNPESTCFCKSFGISASKPLGDVRAYKTQDYLYLEVLTEKGEKLLNGLGNILEETDGADAISLSKEIDEKIEKLPLANLKPSDFRDKQLEVFNSPKWKQLSSACLGCGACTFVCPTCQCYDIREFKVNGTVKRFRCWDSCMYNDFTLMAHGTPRVTGLERFRQRFMHKLVYYPMNNNGVYGCVGCGRCLQKCPIKMNIVKVMKSLGE